MVNILTKYKGGKPLKSKALILKTIQNRIKELKLIQNKIDEQLKITYFNFERDKKLIWDNNKKGIKVDLQKAIKGLEELEERVKLED